MLKKTSLFLILACAIPALGMAAKPAPKPVPTAGPSAELMLKDGDRVVFLGDSITEFGNYTNVVESYLTLRYPKMKLQFFNAGWAGDNSEGGLFRLERDVLKLKPSVVTICFGMNDAYYMKPEAWVGDLYAAHMKDIVTKLKAAGVRVALLTVGIVEEEGEKNAWMKDIAYNSGGLEMMRKKGLEFAQKEGLPIFDIHTLMTQIQAKAKAADKEFNMLPDGIHPDEGGGMIMAYALLKSLGVPARSERLALNVADGSVSSTSGISAGSLERNLDGSLRLKLKMESLPYFVGPKSKKILPYLPWQPEYNHFEFKVFGLKGRASLQFGDEPSAYLDAEDFEKGFSLEEMEGSAPLALAAAVGEFCLEKTKVYQGLWRNLALKPNFNQYEVMHHPEIHDMAIADNLRLQEIEAAMATPPAAGFEITIYPWPTQGELLNNGDWVKCVSISPALPFDAHLNESATAAADLTSTAQFWSLRRLNVGNPGNNLGFLGVSKDKEKAVAYVALSFDSPLAQLAELKIGKDDEFEAWFNGKPLFKSKKGGALKEDSDVTPLSLKRGPNFLLIRAVQLGKGWALMARLDKLKRPVMSWPAALELTGAKP